MSSNQLHASEQSLYVLHNIIKSKDLLDKHCFEIRVWVVVRRLRDLRRACRDVSIGWLTLERLREDVKRYFVTNWKRLRDTKTGVCGHLWFSYLNCGLVRTGKALVHSAFGIFWESYLAFLLISFALAVIIVSVNKAAVCLGCWLAQPLLETWLLSHPIFDDRRPPPTDNIWQYLAIYHDIGQWEPQFPAISFSDY